VACELGKQANLIVEDKIDDIIKPSTKCNVPYSKEIVACNFAIFEVGFSNFSSFSWIKNGRKLRFWSQHFIGILLLWCEWWNEGLSIGLDTIIWDEKGERS